MITLLAISGLSTVIIIMAVWFYMQMAYNGRCADASTVKRSQMQTTIDTMQLIILKQMATIKDDATTLIVLNTRIENVNKLRDKLRDKIFSLESDLNGTDNLVKEMQIDSKNKDEDLHTMSRDFEALNKVHDEFVDRSQKDHAFMLSLLNDIQLDRWHDFKIKFHTNNGKVKCVVVMRSKGEYGSALSFLANIGEVIETVGIRATVIIPALSIITVAAMKMVDHLEDIHGELLTTTR